MSAVVTRIAPSPTGAMHIGNARAALFNWLYAHHTGGKFLLRIEDTDRQRSTESAVQVIFDSLEWLGLQWEGAPVFQFARAAHHQDIVRQLIERGWAFRRYMTPEEPEEAKAGGLVGGPVGAAVSGIGGAVIGHGAGNSGNCRDPKGRLAKCPTAVPPANQCKKGKLCGNTCISVKDTCDK